MKKAFIVLLMINLVFLLTSCNLNASNTKSGTKSSTYATTTCKLNLRVTVRQGLNVNYAVSGLFTFDGSHASHKGNLIEENQITSHPILFYFDGPVIHFILETDKGRIFGTGIMDSSLSTCLGNGGGTQSGPATGDLGDWRGKWIEETHTITVSDAPQEQSDGSAPFSWFRLIFASLPIAIVIGLVVLTVILLAWVSRPFKTTGSPKIKKANASLQKINPNTRSKPATGETHLVEYLATYNADDKLFDLSFQIEKSSQYFGECGVLIAKTLDTKSEKATALEIWVFDKTNTQSISQILMSDFCNSQESLRNEMEKKGQAILIQPGETVILETKALRINAKILQVEYMPDVSYPESVFKKVVMQISIWKHAS